MLLPILRASTKEATAKGESLALIEPRNMELRVRAKTSEFIEAERLAFRAAARQQQLLDKELAEFEPCPLAVAIAFTDQDGVRHSHQCGDWETTATYFNMRRRGVSEAEIIEHLRTQFTQQTEVRRIFLAMGTVAKRPRQWLLLGVLRVQQVPSESQGQLALAL